MVQQILEKIVYNVILMEIEYMLQMVNILNQMLRMLLMDRDIILIMFLITKTSHTQNGISTLKIQQYRQQNSSLIQYR